MPLWFPMSLSSPMQYSMLSGTRYAFAYDLTFGFVKERSGYAQRLSLSIPSANLDNMPRLCKLSSMR